VTAGYAGLRIIDVSNPADPWNVGSLLLSGGSRPEARRVAVRGSTAYVGAEIYGEGAIVLVDVSDPARPVQMGFHQMSAHVASIDAHVASIFVDDDYIYATESEGGLAILRRR
jgi:hypothetical protein